VGEIGTGKKRCGTCQETKAKDCFTISRCEKDGLAKRCKACWKLYRQRNEERIKAYLATYRENHREKAKQTSFAWRKSDPAKARESGRRSRIKRKPHLGETRKAWLKENREKIRIAGKEIYARHQEQYREKRRQHYLKNKPLYRSKDRKRRGIKLNATGSHTSAQIENLFLNQSGQCAIQPCGKRLVSEGSGKYHIDHIIPLSRGGSDDISNISLICPFCNRSKGAKTMDEYLKWLGRIEASAA
jgi:5-methylcytosine-specific restriction endonuclease McrA